MITAQKINLLTTAPSTNDNYYFPSSGEGRTYRISTGQLAQWITSKDLNLKDNNYTISNSDQRSLISFIGNGSYSLLVPSHAEDPITIGTIIDIANNGPSILSISKSPGVTINSPDGIYIVNYGLASLIKIAENNWILSGSLSYHPDKYLGEVSLLAHMNGTDGASSFIDSSSIPKTINFYGDVKTSSTKYKYTPTSAYFDGGHNALTISTSEDFNFSNKDFCLELWVYVNDYNPNNSRILQSRNGDSFSGFSINITSSGNLGIYCSSNGTSWDIISQASLGVIPKETWTNITLSRKSNLFLVFINGNIVYSTTSTASLYYNSGDTVIIGGQSTGTNRSLNGYIDEVRITKGASRYSQNFQLGNIAFPDGSTSILIQPQLIPGLKLWLDASDSSSLYDSVDGASNAGPNGAIARWEDNGGENHHAIQNDNAKRPIRKASERNSRDVVLFDGSNDCLIVPDLWLPSYFSVFIVQSSVVANNTKFWIEHGSDSTTNSGFSFQGVNSTSWSIRRSSNYHYGLSGNSDWIGSGWSLGSFIYNGTGYVYKNGSLISSQSSSGSSLSSSIITDVLNIGSRNQSSLFLNGSIAEILIYDTPLSNTLRLGIENYLMNRWNIV